MVITIKDDVSYEVEIKKSRFICQLKRVTSQEAARAFIAAVKREHRLANHHCTAYTLGEHQEIQRSSDGGEPSGTAGVPMLEMLKKYGITNVCAVVTRYFGGIKLGSGGLIRAYAGSVNEAIKTVGRVVLVEQIALHLELEYAQFDRLQHLLQVEKIPIVKSDFSSVVTVEIFIDESAQTSFLSVLTEKFAGKIKITTGIKHRVEVDFDPSAPL